MTLTMRYFSMFSGIGGFELGIQKATKGKWKCIGYSEIDKYAIETYKKHFPKHKNYGNARDINPEELKDFDLLVGGFPCQSFSIAGKRKGFQDTRGTLFHEICRIVAVKKPRLLLLENVKGLLSADDGRCFATIITSLEKLGYLIEWQVLNSKHFGVPQNRERVFIIGHLRGRSSRQIFPISKSSKQTKEYNKCNKPTAIYFDDSIPKAKTRRGRVMDISGALMATFRGGLAYCIDANYYKGQNNPNKCNRTIISEGICFRRFTPIECERLQGFPDNWVVGNDTQRYKQCGNAVTVNVIEAITEQLIAL